MRIRYSVTPRLVRLTSRILQISSVDREAEVDFFEVRRSRAWVMVRRIAHSSHHRGQQMAMLRMLGRDLHSNYGPTADTGGLMQNEAKVIYAYPEVGSLLEGESAGGRKAPLPGPGAKPPTERPSRDELG